LLFSFQFFIFVIKLAGGGRFLKPSADRKYTGDNRISGARGVATLTERGDETFSVKQFFLLTENEAPQDAHTPDRRV